VFLCAYKQVSRRRAAGTYLPDTTLDDDSDHGWRREARNETKRTEAAESAAEASKQTGLLAVKAFFGRRGLAEATIAAVI
jgi:hypothetical protein